MLNLKLLWSYIDRLNTYKNEIVLTLVPVGHVNVTLGNNSAKDLLNAVS